MRELGRLKHGLLVRGREREEGGALRFLNFFVVWEGELSGISSVSPSPSSPYPSSPGINIPFNPHKPPLSAFSNSPISLLPLPQLHQNPHAQSHMTSPQASTCPRPPPNRANRHRLVRQRRVHDRGTVRERGQVWGCKAGAERGCLFGRGQRCGGRGWQLGVC